MYDTPRKLRTLFRFVITEDQSQTQSIDDVPPHFCEALLTTKKSNENNKSNHNNNHNNKPSTLMFAFNKFSTSFIPFHFNHNHFWVTGTTVIVIMDSKRRRKREKKETNTQNRLIEFFM